MGFKGSRKSTPYAAQLAAEDAGKKASEHGVKIVDIEVQGPGFWKRICTSSSSDCRFSSKFD